MGRFAAILFVVTGTVALQVVAQAVLLASVRFIGRRTRGAGELRRTFWISLRAVLPLFFGHFAQVGLWAEFLVLFGALQTYNAERRVTGRSLRASRHARRSRPRVA